MKHRYCIEQITGVDPKISLGKPIVREEVKEGREGEASEVIAGQGQGLAVGMIDIKIPQTCRILRHLVQDPIEAPIEHQKVKPLITFVDVRYCVDLIEEVAEYQP